MKKAPYNVGFGLYLYQQQERAQSNFPEREQIMKDITYTGLKAFDVYRIAENASELDLSDLLDQQARVTANMRDTYLKFV